MICLFHQNGKTLFWNHLLHLNLTIRCQKLKRIIAHAFETTNKFDKLKNWVHTWLLSSGQDSGKNFLDLKHVLKHPSYS